MQGRKVLSEYQLLYPKSLIRSVMQIGQFTNKNKQKLFCGEICFPKNPLYEIRE